MPAIRVLYDISGLGVGHIAVQGRAGSHRVDRQLVEMLAASPECELLFCANESSLAWQGCADYLRDHPSLAHVPLVAPPASWLARRLRAVVVPAHRRVKVWRAGRALPALLRSGGSLLDTRVHPPVVDAQPPVDVLHSATTPLPPPAPRGRGPRRFVTIYDLRASRPDASPHEVAHEQALLASVRDGDGILTSSEATRRELYARGIAAERISLVPLAADTALFHPVHAGVAAADRAIRDRIVPSGRPYVLMLEAPHPRKNVARAVDAFARLVQQERVDDLALVLAGDQARPDRVAAYQVRHPGLRGRIAATGYLTDHDLGALYRGALCFVYPSLYEGFGLPPLEAMQCGTPVVTANTSSLPEVVGDAGAMVDPLDVDAFAGAMLALYRHEAVRADASARGLAQAQRFSWAGTLAATLAAYRSPLR
ncbi:MAG: glycosyltransferase family 1 protein [Vicinamibacteraceae bacterium]